ncbi:MAG: hypothetical protein WAV21_02325 [Minisyncoccia bacterium]
MNNNTSPNFSIEAVVMRRVRTIRALQWASQGSVVAVLLSIIALWGLGREVWVARVFANAPSDLLLVPRFFIDAFINTRFPVQALSIAVLTSLLWLSRESVRTMADSIRMLGAQRA